ncbi:hypothetical protein EYY95_08470 [Hafnia alvei]|nr:SUMF1/EgtB/PvdO family nonheme iron enzyme [Hafnia alvei]TBL89055.1 hypothetical protein EYY95_08470 [Hafnia alvei]WNN54079.1 SUMF1/EgtB/PvdO family nonheme iron enzyme [Hafnia alvei]
MDLPTEQQWEYAARNRGQFILYPTDSGIVEPGRNVPRDTDKERTDSVLQYKMMPVGMFPPNPLGIYDLASNGWEWTRDVYKEWTNNDKYKDGRVVRSQSIGSPVVHQRFHESVITKTIEIQLVALWHYECVDFIRFLPL